MTWLLTNDDGVEADGLAALVDAMPPAADFLVVAPMRQCSECSHSVTTSRPLQIVQRAERIFAVDGTPVDCVRVALHVLDTSIDVVLSGVNHGANLGVDVHLSGTVAAAREAALHGLTAIAISQYRHPSADLDWSRPAQWLPGQLETLIKEGQDKRRLGEQPGFFNVNLPAQPTTHAPNWVRTVVDRNPLPMRFQRRGSSAHYEGDYHSRPRESGTDIDVCFRGDVSVSYLLLS